MCTTERYENCSRRKVSTVWLGSPDGRMVPSTSLFDSSSSGSSRRLDPREVNNGPDDKSGSGGDGALPMPNLEVPPCFTSELCTPSPAATLSRTNVPGMNVNSSLGSAHSPLRTLSVEFLVDIRSSSPVAREGTPARLIWDNEGDPLLGKPYMDIWPRPAGYRPDVSQRNSTLSSGASLSNATGNNNKSIMSCGVDGDFLFSHPPK